MFYNIKKWRKIERFSKSAYLCRARFPKRLAFAAHLFACSPPFLCSSLPGFLKKKRRLKVGLCASSSILFLVICADFQKTYLPKGCRCTADLTRFTHLLSLPFFIFFYCLMLTPRVLSEYLFRASATPFPHQTYYSYLPPPTGSMDRPFW